MSERLSASRPRPSDASGLRLESTESRVYHEIVIAALMLVMIVLGATATGAPFTIDEVIYLGGSFAMADHGRLTIENGYLEMPSETLILKHMVVGPHGLVPQYPSGTFLFAWPFVELFGARGLAIMNGCAAAASLWLTRSIALALFHDRTIATGSVILLGVASFLPDYAAALWPHALALAFVLAAIRLAIASAEVAGTNALLLSLAAGLLLGITLTVRVDAILIAPPVALWLIYASRRPLITIAGMTLGFGIGLLAAAILNFLKFDQFSPLTYGQDDDTGGTSFSTYEPLILPLFLGCLIALGVAIACRRTTLVPRVLAVAGSLTLLGGIAAVALIPALRAEAANLSEGLVALIVDARYLNDPRPGVQYNPDGTLSVFGFPKQALGQSLPWIGIILALSLTRETMSRWRGIALCGLIIGTLVAFFARTSWHGGLSANMRYLLPTLPFFAMLAAFAIRDIAARAEGMRPWNTVLLGAVTFVVILAAIVLFSNDPAWFLFWSRQPFATGVLLIVVMTAALSRWPGRPGRRAAVIAQLAVGGGLAYAVVFAAMGDWYLIQKWRNDYANRAASIPHLAEPYLMLGRTAESAADVLWDPNGWLGVPPYDPAFLEDVLRSGRRVIGFKTDTMVALVEASPALRFADDPVPDLVGELSLTDAAPARDEVD